MNSFARIAPLLLVFSMAATAESPIDGGWAGQIPTDDGSQPIAMSLHVDDSKLSGSIIGAGGVETSIQDGTFSGTALAFTTVQRDGDNTTTFKCTGSVSGDSISLSCATKEDGSDAREFTVTRQK